MITHRSIAMVLRGLRQAALIGAVLAALCACSSSDEAGPAKAADAGAGGSGAIFHTGPDAAHLTHAGDGAVSECGGFGRVAACKTCLQSKCCDAATTCARTGGCKQNAACIEACDGKHGDAGTACAQACADQYFAAAGPEYNGLVLCMNQSCKTECPFTGP